MNYKKLKKGDQFTFRGRVGVLLSLPEYVVTSRSGLFYATVQWQEGTIQKEFMICRTDIKWEARN